MSGNRLARTLPKLQSDWAANRHSNPGWPQFIEAVQLAGIRGWTGQWVEFRFPVVAIAGENGSGKSTILKAVASAYRPPAADPAAREFSPDDFFPTTPWEDVSGVRIAFRIRRGDDVITSSLRKQTSRWRGMPERPQRRVSFQDISRTQPVDTLIGYGRVARTELAKAARYDLKSDSVTTLSRILGRSYDEGALVRDDRGKQVGIVKSAGVLYSNFHQGAGEDATTDLIALLQEIPRNSLILIDEVESSLHPRAQRRLMTELIQIATARRLQLIVTTHSPYVLEQLPAEARIYLRSTRDNAREPIYGVTPEYALSLMDDEHHPELILYCEDAESGQMVDAILRRSAPHVLSRIRITEVGPSSTVKALGKLAADEKLTEGGIGVLDGDVAISDGCIKLPGEGSPEEVVYRSMTELTYDAVAERLGVRSGDLQDYAEDALTITNNHVWSREIAKRLGGRFRATKVWEAFLDVWVMDILDETLAQDFSAAVSGLLPVIAGD